ncbi:MAG: SLC13 family permease [Candidatus Contendobacter sp.]|nr:SLC13 family permease [Candidatus Contendobacter sp.]
MSPDALFVFGLLAVTVVLFASDRLRPDVVALLVIVALILGGILPVSVAVAGFGDPLIILIAGLFVVGEGLVRTGIAFQVGQGLARLAGASESRLLVLLMLAVAGLGAFMSSTGVVAIFIPVVLGLTGRLSISPGRLMMPMAFAALLSGLLTLIATPPNLVVNDALRSAGLHPFGFFGVTPIGLLILALGIGYMAIIGSRLLPSSVPNSTAGHRKTLRELGESYQLVGQLHRLRLAADSSLVGQTVAEARLRTRYGLTLIGVERPTRFAETVSAALANTELHPADVLYGVGSAAAVEELIAAERLLRLPITDSEQQRLIQELGLAEVMLPPDSALIGQTLRQAAFRSHHALSVLGIRRRGQPLVHLAQEKLAFGDVLLVVGAWKRIALLQNDPKDFLVLNLAAELSEVAPSYRQAPFALAILLAMVALMTFGWVSNVVAVLLAALAMGLCRCLRMEDAYRAINWPSLVVIAGMLPLAKALEQTGGVALIADGLVAGLGPFGPLALLAGVFVLAALIGMFISNTATALLMAPIAIAAAQQVGVSPYPFAMTVVIAASAAFVTPVSSPVNTLVLAPGGYRFNDFVRVGLPLLLLVMGLTLLLTPLLLPL